MKLLTNSADITSNNNNNAHWDDREEALGVHGRDLLQITPSIHKEIAFEVSLEDR